MNQTDRDLITATPDLKVINATHPHPAITDQFQASFDADHLVDRLRREGFSETNIVAALLMRLKWLNEQPDEVQLGLPSALTSRLLAIASIEEKVEGITQGIRAALENPELFRMLLNMHE